MKAWRNRQTDAQQRGQSGEDRALAVLQQQGLKLITRNFSCRLGELDLIMQDRETLVIVEVRYRADQRYGGALASITPAKQQKIVRATRFYLCQHPWPGPIRFDVLALTGDQHQWLKNAWLVND
ncbi:MAG: YraN family protein [Methylococcales bacterium]|nr:YraN family protein [Methylococcales bacterium]